MLHHRNSAITSPSHHPFSEITSSPSFSLYCIKVKEKKLTFNTYTLLALEEVVANNIQELTHTTSITKYMCAAEKKRKFFCYFFTFQRYHYFYWFEIVIAPVSTQRNKVRSGETGNV